MANEDSEVDPVSDHETDSDAVPSGTYPPLLPPMLFELHGTASKRPTDERRRYLSKAEKRFIAYRLAEGDTCRAIGLAMGVSEATVRSFKRRLLSDAGILLDCGFSVPVNIALNRKDKLRWFCRYCRDLRKTPMGAGRHAIEHLR